MVDILLVDDETYVTESLALTIPWQEIGVHGVYQAASAAEALEVLMMRHIDILVTDIRMPEQTGLELIEQAKDRWPRLKTVLLTGYSDFEYAQRAIKLRAGDYLLKPVDDDAFIRCISSQVKVLTEERKRMEEEQSQQYARKSEQAVLRSQLMQELLLGRRRPDALLNRLLQQYELEFRVDQACTLLTVQLAGRFMEMDRPSIELIEYAIGNIAEETFRDPYHVWHSSSSQDHVVILVALREGVASSYSSKEMMKRLCESLQQKVMSYLDGEISIVASDWFNFPEQLSKHYREALTTLYRIRLDEPKLVMMDELSMMQLSSHSALEELHKPPTFINLLESGQWQAAKDKLDAFFISSEQHTREKLYEAFIAISNGLIYVASKMGVDLHSIDPQGVNLLLDRSFMLTATHLRAWSNEMLDLLSIQYDESDSYHKKHIIKQVQELVSKELGVDTSVKTIADRVYLHPVYLSKLYKQETGESLGDYIIRIRMEKAVYMLKHTNKKIYEITTELGYQNPQYFSKVFKKYYGCTPNEYRDQ
ncbi:response regulator [Paenibacillus sp. FSL W7-1287]|uniref:response regulator n=1 Tax=Paenibacillus sp. FSL W7-1287 TaxID=2954538 RepID=UPI0030FADEE8